MLIRDARRNGVFAISSACHQRRRIAASWWTLREAYRDRDDPLVEDGWGAGDDASIPDLSEDSLSGRTVPNAQNAVDKVVF